MSDDKQPQPQHSAPNSGPPAHPQGGQPKKGNQNSGFADKRGLITIVAIFGSLFVVLLLFAVVMLSAFGNGSGFGAGANQVGIVEIKGPIMESKKTVADLRAFARNENIRAIVVRIDSPGGAVAPSQEIFQAVKRAAEKKPLVASMGTTAASGGYYIAIGAPRIFANPGTVTGSIGVISQVFNVEGLLSNLNVDVHTIKTGQYKDSGSPFREFTAADRHYFDALISDIYEQFIGDVAAARGMELAAVREVADGRVFSGRQAKELKLVDELGSLQDAVDWVKKKAEIEGEASLVYPPEEDLGFMSTLIKGATQTAVQEIRSQQTPVLEFRMP